MRQRGQPTGYDERLAIIERAEQGQSDQEIAQALGCSVWTVRKWRRKGQHQGRSGLKPTQGRPAEGVLSSFPPALQEAIRQMRAAHPGWGPITILAELRQQDEWRGVALPSRAQVARFLKALMLSRRYERHIELPQPAWVPVGTPHAVWQLDAQGATQVAGLGRVCLINIVDTVSRLKVESYPSLAAASPAHEDYQLALRRAFLTYGLPQQLSFDHGAVFYDNTTASPYPTRLHLWLLALGIDVRFTRKRRPTDHALVERTHQILHQHALAGQSWVDQSALWEGLDQRRTQLNTILPVRTLHGQAPLQAYPHARHSGRPYCPASETQQLDLTRVYSYLAQGRWFRHAKPTYHVALGGYIYYLGRPFNKGAVEIVFDTATRHFLCRPEGSDQVRSLPAQGLTAEALMGELALFQSLPSYQLALPFSSDAWRQLVSTQALKAA